MSINLGILGFAHGHVGMYCAQWKQMAADKVRLIAGWDHDQARAQKAAAQFSLAVESTAEKLLARKDIHAVVIGAETSLHADLVELAAAAGKAIVLQKPLALTLAQADHIVDVVEKTGVKFTLAWQMRVDPQNLRMRELVRTGELGRVYMLRRRHGLPTQLWPDFDKSWHVQPELNRGMWADDACHAIDFIYWIFGEPVSVMAELDTLRNPRIPDDHGVAVFRFADGTFAEVASSFVCLAGENTTEIVAEKGMVIQNFGDLVSCGAPRAADAVGLKWFFQEQKSWINSGIPSPVSHGERINALAQPVLDFLAGQREPICTAREGRTVLRMTLACHRSSELGRRVALVEVQSD